jgi:hypothetical protein
LRENAAMPSIIPSHAVRAVLSPLCFAVLISTAFAGPLGNTVRVPSDEPDLQTAINQVQGLSAATVIIEDSAGYAGPIRVTDSVAIRAADGAAPVIDTSGFPAALRIEVPTVPFKPAVAVTLTGITLRDSSGLSGPGAPLLDIVHRTDQTELDVDVAALELLATAGYSRSCMAVSAVSNAAPVNVTAVDIECRTNARNGVNTVAVDFDAPDGSLAITGDSRVEIFANDPAVTPAAIALTNLDSGETLPVYIANADVLLQGRAGGFDGLRASHSGTDVSMLDSRLIVDAITTPPPRGTVPIPSRAVAVESGASVDIQSSRLINDSDIAVDFVAFASDSAGGGQPSMLTLRNSLLHRGRVHLFAGNSGAAPTAVEALLVNNTIYAPVASAVTLQTQASPSIGLVTFDAWSNLLIAFQGIELDGSRFGLIGQWDHNAYDVSDTAISAGLSTGTNAVLGDARVIDPQAGLFTPRRDSPLVDAGNTAVAQTYLGFSDLAGHWRYDNGLVDIGAYELRTGPLFRDRFE